MSETGIVLVRTVTEDREQGTLISQEALLDVVFVLETYGRVIV